MKLTFLGADREVTGSCTQLEAAGHRILIDCGMEQGRDVYENADLPYAPGTYEALLLTHAHIDHSGRIPYLYKNGYRGPIYTTDATRDLCAIMLEDSAHIQEQEAEWKNRKAMRSGAEMVEPDYTVEDAEKVMQQFVPCPYETWQNLFDGPTGKIEMPPAGQRLHLAARDRTGQAAGDHRFLRRYWQHPPAAHQGPRQPRPR